MDDTEVQISTENIEGDICDVVHISTTDAFGLQVAFEMTLDSAAELGELLARAVAR